MEDGLKWLMSPRLGGRRVALFKGPYVIKHVWMDGTWCWRVAFSMRGRERCIFDMTEHYGRRIRVLGITVKDTTT